MDKKYINPFLLAVDSVLSQFGITDVQKGAMSVKQDMVIENDVTAFVGIVGEVRGNIAYSFNTQTAMNIVSTMMMGTPVERLDELARSAIGELSNMFAGNAISFLDAEKVSVDISTPSVIVGEDIYLVLGTVQTLVVEFVTQVGTIEVSIGLE